MKPETKENNTRNYNNLLPTATLTFILWIILSLLVLLFSPKDQYALPLFFLLMFLSLFFLLALVFANSRRGFLLSAAITLFLLLRYLGQGHLLNALLLFGIVITLEIISHKARPSLN